MRAAPRSLAMRWLAVASVLLLAGCAGSPGPANEADAAAGPEGAGDGRTARGYGSDEGGGRFDASFDLRIMPQGMGGSVCVTGTCIAYSDCILFWDESSDYGLSNGTAVLSWSAATPLAESLVLEVGGSPPTSATGPSPLTVTFDELAPDANGLGVTFGVDHAVPNVPILQDVVLTLSFDFEGDLPAAIRSTC